MPKWLNSCVVDLTWAFLDAGPELGRVLVRTGRGGHEERSEPRRLALHLLASNFPVPCYPLTEEESFSSLQNTRAFGRKCLCRVQPGNGKEDKTNINE